MNYLNQYNMNNMNYMGQMNSNQFYTPPVNNYRSPPNINNINQNGMYRGNKITDFDLEAGSYKANYNVYKNNHPINNIPTKY